MASSFERRIAAPDEHPAVPVVPPGFDEPIGQRLVRLLVESQHMKSARHVQRFAAMNVSQPRVPVGRNNAERHERFRPLCDHLKRGFQTLLELFHRLDDMVGGDDGANRVGIPLVQNRRREPHRVGGIPAHRFAQEILLRHLRQTLQHRRRMRGRGTDENPLRRQHTQQPLVTQLQQAPAVDHRQNLFGPIRPGHRPEPSPRSSSQNYTVLHRFTQ
jgi:hypothetical protein